MLDEYKGVIKTDEAWAGEWGCRLPSKVVEKILEIWDMIGTCLFVKALEAFVQTINCF
jgi:hypothetical protein